MYLEFPIILSYNSCVYVIILVVGTHHSCLVNEDRNRIGDR